MATLTAIAVLIAYSLDSSLLFGPENELFSVLKVITTSVQAKIINGQTTPPTCSDAFLEVTIVSSIKNGV